MKLLISLALFGASLCAHEIDAKRMLKGEKIAQAFCDRTQLPKDKSPNEIQKLIESTQVCKPLAKTKLEDLVYYLANSSTTQQGVQQTIAVPQSAKCPVCGMLVYKYPKWTAHMVVEGKSYYFDGVKDMMKYYIFDGDFPYDREKISLLEVNDYYTLEAINAKDAFFVYDSNLYGPMGRELIPFRDEASAKTFMLDHNGKKIVRFGQVTDALIMALDD